MNEVEETIEWLFANEAKEMKKICNKEMAKFGGIYEMDYHDFYSQVGWDISKAKKRYDSSKGKSFKDYIHKIIKFLYVVLFSCVKGLFKTFIFSIYGHLLVKVNTFIKSNIPLFFKLISLSKGN